MPTQDNTLEYRFAEAIVGTCIQLSTYAFCTHCGSGVHSDNGLIHEDGCIVLEAKKFLEDNTLEVAEDFENKIVEVCSNCKCASCWHGRFMCDESATADLEKYTVSQLREMGTIENEDNWSDETMTKIYGEPAPYGYKEASK